jgi:hypothetical protein
MCCCAAAAGGWRALYVFYHRIVLAPKCCVWVDNGQGGVNVPIINANGKMVTKGNSSAFSPREQQVNGARPWHAAITMSIHCVVAMGFSVACAGFCLPQPLHVEPKWRTAS